jgi:hypothetical protein
MSKHRSRRLTIMDPRDDKTEQGGLQANHMATGVAVGLALGVALGSAMDNLALGIALGIAIGSAIGVAWSSGAAQEQQDSQSDVPAPDDEPET